MGRTMRTIQVTDKEYEIIKTHLRKCEKCTDNILNHMAKAREI